jgi:uncharacterized heparinase superfamily protein
VTATPTRSEGAVLLRLDNGKGWIFRAEEGRIDLEESIYTARPGKVRRTLQMVVSIPGSRSGTRIRLGRMLPIVILSNCSSITSPSPIFRSTS